MDYRELFLHIVAGIILITGWGVTVENVGFFTFLFTWVLALMVLQILPIYLDRRRKDKLNGLSNSEQL